MTAAGAPSADPVERARAARDALTRLVREVPDFPQPGIVFRDITPLLEEPGAFAAVVAALADAGRGPDGAPAVDRVLGMESRGFIFAAPVALALGVGFVPVRKAGRLPRATFAVSYALEYAEATLEIHQDALRVGDRVLLVDDVLATGGTARATCDLVARAGATVAGVAVLLELPALRGRQRLAEVPLTCLGTA